MGAAARRESRALGIADAVNHREPFAADVSEGKNDPIYNAHSYHTKVPHKAIMRYILHYTEPGDIVLDGSADRHDGRGGAVCGEKQAVEELKAIEWRKMERYMKVTRGSAK